MLTHLLIQNLVLIERAELEFSRGLIVLSGETGAGKSILLDALGLALGSRGEARLVRGGTEKANVTASFDIADNPRLKERLGELGVEAEDELILRRILSSDGKSKAFANDAPIGIKALAEIGELLVEIHGQHQQRGLLDPREHLALLDGYARSASEQQKAAAAYRRWKETLSTIQALDAELEQASRERDYLEHMRGELGALSPESGEEELLALRRTTIMQSEKMAQTLAEATGALESPRRVTEALRAAGRVLARSSLQEAASFGPAIEALDKAANEVEVASDVLRALADATGYDSRELEETEERLFALRAAARKYHVGADELKALLESVEGKLAALDRGDADRMRLDTEAAAQRADYLAAAKALRDKRQAAAEKLQSALEKELKPLKMEATRFSVDFAEREERGWNASGIDQVQFVATTNPGSPAGPLAAIASGGELSRFMLALAVVLAGIEATPTMIFDEIDTGTGGAVADAIGKRLELLGHHAQVLVVTHLPQVAARGAAHFHIEKSVKKGATVTEVRRLDHEGRREELARMLSGAEISTEARAAADRLLGPETGHAA